MGKSYPVDDMLFERFVPAFNHSVTVSITWAWWQLWRRLETPWGAHIHSWRRCRTGISIQDPVALIYIPCYQSSEHSAGPFEEPSADHPSPDHPSLDHPSLDHPSLDHPSTDHPSLDHPSVTLLVNSRSGNDQASEKAGFPRGAIESFMGSRIVLKVIGTGISNWILWKDTQVVVCTTLDVFDWKSIPTSYLLLWVGYQLVYWYSHHSLP